MATSRSVGNYSTSAKAVIRASDQIFDAAMSGKPDFTKISKEAIKGRSMERRAVTRAEGNVAQAGLEAFTKAKRTQNAADTAKEINDIKRPAKRMAGVVAGLGAIGGALVMNKNAKEDKAEREALRADQQAVWDQQTAMMGDLRSQSKALREQINSFNDQPIPGPTTLPKNDGSTSPSSGSTSTTTSATTKPPAVVSKPVNVSSAKPGASFKKIYNIAKSVGGSKFPEVVAAQAMHETGHLNPNLKSVYNSSGGTNPFGQTGDRGYGTIPREGFSDGWTKYPDLTTAVKDHITLWHDTKNHGGNYNAFGSVRDGIASVTPSYSPNADPVNIRKGFTEDAYSKSMRKILENNGFTF